MQLIDQIAEARIQAATEQGEFDDLPGAGRPLPPEDTSHIPEHLRAAYRVLKNAGFLPPELECRRETANAEQLIREARSSEERGTAVTRLSLLMARLSRSRGREVDLRAEQTYVERLHRRFDREPK